MLFISTLAFLFLPFFLPHRNSADYISQVPLPADFLLSSVNGLQKKKNACFGFCCCFVLLLLIWQDATKEIGAALLITVVIETVVVVIMVTCLQFRKQQHPMNMGSWILFQRLCPHKSGHSDSEHGLKVTLSFCFSQECGNFCSN